MLEILLYLSIPLSSGFIGWLTNKVAVKMTFYPIKYVGIKPFGWQGIIPSKSEKMSEKAVDLMTGKLFKMDEAFSLLDPKIVSELMSPSLIKVSKKTVDDIMEAEIPTIWDNLPQSGKEYVYDKVIEQVPEMTQLIMGDIQENIYEMLDLKKLVIEAIKNDKQIINDIFWSCGKREFEFIEKSGFIFGSMFGLTQMVIVYFYNPWWLLPLFGVLVGYLTNWLALKLIFEPNHPIKIGPYTFLGLFLKRQNEVAHEYSRIIVEKVLTTERLFNYLLRHTGSQKLEEILNFRMKENIQATYDNIKDWIETFVDGEQVQRHMNIITNIAVFNFMKEFYVCARDAFDYADETFDLQNLLETRMKELPYDEFEAFLRPAFQEDELTLIIVGAILGGFAGVLQYIVLFSGMIQI